MSILLKKVLKKNPLRPEEDARIHLSAKSVGTMNEKQVAKEMADEVTLNPKEAEMGMHQLRKIVLRNLLNGYTVKLGDWATFYVTVTSEGSNNEKDAKATKVKRVKMHLRYDKSFEEELQKASFVTMDSLQTKECECEEP